MKYFKNEIKKTILFLLFLFFSFSVALGYNVTGAGHRTCGSMIDEDRKDNKIGIALKKSWIMGFISGLNFGYDSSKNPDRQAVYYAVLNYCKKNPLKMIAESVVYVYHNKM